METLDQEIKTRTISQQDYLDEREELRKRLVAFFTEVLLLREVTKRMLDLHNQDQQRISETSEGDRKEINIENTIERIIRPRFKILDDLYLQILVMMMSPLPTTIYNYLMCVAPSTILDEACIKPEAEGLASERGGLPSYRGELSSEAGGWSKPKPKPIYSE